MRTKRIYEDREIWKEYALLSRNGICREYALFGIILTQIWLRQMRFDSDFTQTSGQKKMVSGASVVVLKLQQVGLGNSLSSVICHLMLYHIRISEELIKALCSIYTAPCPYAVLLCTFPWSSCAWAPVEHWRCSAATPVARVSTVLMSIGPVWPHSTLCHSNKHYNQTLVFLRSTV